MDEALSAKCDSDSLNDSLAVLTEQLDRLTASKAGKEELHEALLQAQRPAVTISRADGSCKTIVSDAEFPENAMGTPPHHQSRRPRSAQIRTQRQELESPLQVLPGREFDVVGINGMHYRGGNAPNFALSGNGISGLASTGLRPMTRDDSPKMASQYGSALPELAPAPANHRTSVAR